jgi:hypothetical protein
MPPLYTNLHDITDEFASAVCHLPVDYNKDAYRQFLDTWGTVCIIKDYYIAIGFVTNNIIGQLHLHIILRFPIFETASEYLFEVTNIKFVI